MVLILGQMLGMILQTGCVELGECQEIYHRFSGVCPALKPSNNSTLVIWNSPYYAIPTVETSPEFNILWGYVGSEDIISAAVIIKRIDKFVSRVGQEAPQGVSLLTQL